MSNVVYPLQENKVSEHAITELELQCKCNSHAAMT